MNIAQFIFNITVLVFVILIIAIVWKLREERQNVGRTCSHSSSLFENKVRSFDCFSLIFLIFFICCHLPELLPRAWPTLFLLKINHDYVCNASAVLFSLKMLYMIMLAW